VNKKRIFYTCDISNVEAEKANHFSDKYIHQYTAMYII